MYTEYEAMILHRCTGNVEECNTANVKINEKLLYRHLADYGIMRLFSSSLKYFATLITGRHLK